MTSVATDFEAGRSKARKKTRSSLWHPEYVEDVLDLAAKVGETPDMITRILNRDLAAGVRLAPKLERETGRSKFLWLDAALPGMPDHCAFLQPPDGPRFISSAMAIRLDREAGYFWTQSIDHHAKELGLPASLLAHVVTGVIGIGRWPSPLGARFALIIGLDSWPFSGSRIPHDHRLKVHLPADVAQRSYAQ